MNTTLRRTGPGALQGGTILVVLLLTIIFDRLFWSQAIGLNLLLFTLVVMAVLPKAGGWRALSVPARIVGFGLLLSAAMVLVHGSVIAILVTWAALFVFTVLVHEPAYRSLLYTVPHFAANLLLVPVEGHAVLNERMKGHRATRQGWRWLRLALLPVIIAGVYLLLYRTANPRFEHLTAGLFNGFFDALWDLLGELFTAHSIFLLFALLLCGGLVLRTAPRSFVDAEARHPDALLRRRNVRPHWMPALAMNALDKERNKGLLLLVLVNALLLVVNVIDIDWLWSGFTVPEGFDLKQFVHEGTWVLIISILLSMVILFYLFRGNQNFHAKSVWLKRAALLWVVQNAILGVSVFLRNYHYIDFHGLAYKRIGVMVFLVLVLVGLATLFHKILHRRSMFTVLRLNAWALFAVFVLLTTVDWDSTIVRYNLHHDNPAEIDIDNYLAMSDKVLPLLYADLEKVERQMAKHQQNRVRWVDHLDPESFREELDRKRDRFLRKYEKRDWRSWTLAHARTYEALKGRTPESE